MSNLVNRFFPLSLPFLPLSFCFPLFAEVVASDAVDVIVVEGCAEADGPAGVEGGAEDGGRDALCLTEACRPTTGQRRGAGCWH